MLEGKYKEFQKQFGVVDNIELIDNIESFIKEFKIEGDTKSKLLTLIGNILCHLAPELRDDYGYRSYREALEINKKNHEAKIGICCIFSTYPYPFCDIVSEKEFLRFISELIDDFDDLKDFQQSNLLQLIKSYSGIRVKIIDTYGE